MKLTVVIVNYNVQYFLEQCLLSVEKAMQGIDGEVFVVDNNSVDGSVKMVSEKFPQVKLIANKENTGFSKANNQAMRIAKGEYVLLLNPDTVVEEDTFRKVISFMDEHQDAGGLGVKMVDGKGKFLPESKRGLPTPSTSFYKIFGISRLFPKSKKFNRYHLGNLDNNKTHEIEILSGAFMLMRKSALDKVGLLDEAFFMYGEDIDLSWRIIQGGWKNYYYSDTTIIHYKGESTKKGSLNYVFVFYNAMVIFARKHFSQQNAELFSFFINLAIWLRAGVAILNRFVKRLILPLADMGALLVLLFFVKRFYEDTRHKIYDDRLVMFAFVAYALIWSFSTWLGGGYDKPLKPQRVFKPVLIGSAVILMGYSLLPETMRFSRALLLIGAAVALAVFFLNRVLYNLITRGVSGLTHTLSKRIAIVGSSEEVVRVKNLLTQIQQEPAYIAPISPDVVATADNTGNISQLSEIVRVHNLDQVIFCARDIPSSEIIATMSSIKEKSIEFKIAPPESLYIIGSGSIETSGDAFMMDVNSVSLISNKRSKRLLDIGLCIAFLALLPIMILVVKKPGGFLRNLAQVFGGMKSWVGYSGAGFGQDQLPAIRPGVIHPALAQPVSGLSQENVKKLDVLYAKDYRVTNDLLLIWKAIRLLGNS
jgi:O-antigen biosynthesis protein